MKDKNLLKISNVRAYQKGYIDKERLFRLFKITDEEKKLALLKWMDSDHCKQLMAHYFPDPDRAYNMALEIFQCQDQKIDKGDIGEYNGNCDNQ